MPVEIADRDLVGDGDDLREARRDVAHDEKRRCTETTEAQGRPGQRHESPV